MILQALGSIGVEVEEIEAAGYVAFASRADEEDGEKMS